MSQRLLIEQLACARGDRVLFSGLDLVLEAGDCARIMGDNGVGKSTFLRTVAGLLEPAEGRVRWQDASMIDEPARLCDNLCFVDHDNALNAVLTPLENLRLLARLGGWNTSSRQVRDTLAGLGLDKTRHRAVGRLSAGQKRRVSLARLWLTEARLWLLDEPAAALDAEARQQLTARIRVHVDAGGMVIYTTHEPLDVPAARCVYLNPPC